MYYLQGRVLQYLGTSCQPELCEGSCPGAHQHYRAGVVPPQLPDTAHIESLGAHDAAAGIAQAQAAATGRPVRLILDLHPRLRCQNFTDMLGLNTTMLQVCRALGDCHAILTWLMTDASYYQKGSTGLRIHISNAG